jgi:hypothetical protein
MKDVELQFSLEACQHVFLPKYVHFAFRSTNGLTYAITRNSAVTIYQRDAPVEEFDEELISTSILNEGTTFRNKLMVFSYYFILCHTTCFGL